MKSPQRGCRNDDVYKSKIDNTMVANNKNKVEYGNGYYHIIMRFCECLSDVLGGLETWALAIHHSDKTWIIVNMQSIRPLGI